jgi:hypothetical protein
MSPMAEPEINKCYDVLPRLLLSLGHNRQYKRQYNTSIACCTDRHVCFAFSAKENAMFYPSASFCLL